MSAPVMDVNGAVTGHIISTTIGGKNGEPKQAKCLENGETVAIKKVLKDRRYKNRELQLMWTMDNPNVVSLKHCFYVNQRMPLIYVKLYTYQVDPVTHQVKICDFGSAKVLSIFGALVEAFFGEMQGYGAQLDSGQCHMPQREDKYLF
ncbi:hypothetical protein BC332_10113 [Capsicum chinense]|nr:hypothetical protein BC332_10113 [Capsicum chinense]